MERDHLFLLPLFKGFNEDIYLNKTDHIFNIKSILKMQLSGFMLETNVLDSNAEIKTIAKNSHKSFIKKFLLMRLCMKKIHEKFMSNKINYVVTKGMAMKLHGMYKSNSREFRDIDILVSKESFEEAYKALRSLGFEYFNKRSSDGINFLGCMHHIPPMINKDGVIIELHHRLTLPEFFDTCPLYKNALDSKIQKEDVYVVSEDILIAHVIYHGLMHNKDNINPVLIFDLKEILVSTNYKKVNCDLFVSKNNFLFFNKIYKHLKNINDKTLYDKKLAVKILLICKSYKYQHKRLKMISKVYKTLSYYSYFYQIGFYSPKLYLIAISSFIRKLRF